MMRLSTGIFALFCITAPLAFAGQFDPPVGIQDEGGTESKPVFTIDCVGAGISCTQSGTTGTLTVSGSGNSFETISVPAGTNPVADLATDTLTITETSPLVITGTAGTDTIDITMETSPASAATVVGTGRTLTGGVGIAALGDLSADRTVTFDATEVVGTTTWGAGAAQTWTIDAGVTDPQLDFASNLIRLQTGEVRVGNAGTVTTTDGDGDLYIEDELEVDGASTFLGASTFGAVTINSSFSVGSIVVNNPGNSDIDLNNSSFMISSGTNGNDDFVISTGVNSAASSGYIIMMEAADRPTDLGYPLVPDPHLIVHSADETAAGLDDRVEIFHDQDSGVVRFRTETGGTDYEQIELNADASAGLFSLASTISTGNDAGIAEATYFTRIGDAGTASIVNGDGDLLIEDALEVDGNTTLGDAAGETTTINDLLIMTLKVTAPATCTEGTIYADDSGALCYCTTANTWEIMNASGACT